MKKANKTRRRPPIACTRVFLADSSFFGSPPAFMYLNPLPIINATQTIPTKTKRAVMIFEITAGMHPIVATPFTTHPGTNCPQSIIKE